MKCPSCGADLWPGLKTNISVSVVMFDSDSGDTGMLADISNEDGSVFIHCEKCGYSSDSEEE
jgi:hypothetical protein